LKISAHADRTDAVAVDVLLICALKDEYDQVLKVTDGLMPLGWQEHPGPNGWIVADGRFATSSGIPLNIQATHASQMGREQAQAIASRLIQAQPARCIAMSGICGGRRGKVTLGDVIFADRLWSYDTGKLTVEDGEQRFQGDMLQYRPSSVWVQRMQHVAIPPSTPWLLQRPALPLEHQEDWTLLRILAGDDPFQHPDFKTACPDWSSVLNRLWKRKWLVQDALELTPSGQQQANRLKLLYPHAFPEPSGFQVHVAPIATGAAVIEDAGIFPRLADSMRKTLGVEMEASALGALGEAYEIPVLVAKGVSDYGDQFKDDRYRQFAARASAECLIALLRNNADLLPGLLEAGAAAPGPAGRPAAPGLPLDLIDELAELYPGVQEARALWQRAGGKASEVEENRRPRDLWQLLWQRSVQGARARPAALLDAALDDHPHNTKLQSHRAALP
jgi:nucleoside phosphorylase